MNIYIVQLEIRDYFAHVEEWVVHAQSKEDAIKMANNHGRVLGCRQAHNELE